jgi:hypothetical protein
MRLFPYIPLQVHPKDVETVTIIHNISVELQTGHDPHSSTLVCICVVWLLFMLFYVLFVSKCVLPLGDNPNAVNKYIISYNNITVYKIYTVNYQYIMLQVVTIQNIPYSLKLKKFMHRMKLIIRKKPL